ncbi:hypothetical protein TMatcc_003484 [Talaromyces marneffei ATCC 18224]
MNSFPTTDTTMIIILVFLPTKLLLSPQSEPDSSELCCVLACACTTAGAMINRAHMFEFNETREVVLVLKRLRKMGANLWRNPNSRLAHNNQSKYEI